MGAGSAMRALSLSLLLLGAACGGPPAHLEVLGEPMTYSGRVVAARGPTMARTGDTCRVEVQRADGRYLNCRIRVRCSDDWVYGLADAGYNHCRREGARLTFAQDSRGTRGDGDPRLFFDLDAGRVIVSDDEPDVEVLVDLVAGPAGYGQRDGAGSRPDDGRLEEAYGAGGDAGE
jgi:hypothetical protein